MTYRERYDAVVTAGLQCSVSPIEDRLRMARLHERRASVRANRMRSLDADSDPDRSISPPADRALAASPTPIEVCGRLLDAARSGSPGDLMAPPSAQ